MSLQRIICNDEQLIHTDNPCQKELARVRGVILFAEEFNINGLLSKLQSGTDEDAAAALTMMDNGIDNGTVHIIPQTSGSYDGGSPHTADGYTDGETRVLWYDYKLDFKDPSFWQNKDFWEKAVQRQWRVAWRTETLLRITDKLVNLSAIDPAEDSLTATVTWNITATWRSLAKPEILPMGALAEYFGTEINISGEPTPVSPTHRVVEWGHITGDITQQTDLMERLATQQHQDISGKQDRTDANLNTDNKTVVGAINELLLLAYAGL